MSLQDQLDAHSERFKQNAPAHIKSAVLDARASHAASFDHSTTIQISQPLPPFTLPNALGTPISSSTLLTHGPLLIIFYRGGWCPFCNLTLHAYQSALPQITALGATLVAISPELPDTSLTTVEKHNLGFEVLSDVGNEYAEKLGIVYRQPESLRVVFETFGNDLKVRNGDDSMKVPVPTTLVVDRTGVVRGLEVETDYTKRLDPKVAVGWIEKIKGQ